MSPADGVRVTLDGQFTVTAARVLDTRWNGWACPLFTREGAEEVARRMTELAAADEAGGLTEYSEYRWEGDALVEIRPYPDPYEGTPGGVETDRWEPDAEGLYAVGAFGWVWSLADEEGEE